MASGYNPIAVEYSWYDWWEKEGFFAPTLTPDGKVKPEGSFVMAFPPPNVTGSLHIGHGLTVAIQDALARWYVHHIYCAFPGAQYFPCLVKESHAGKNNSLGSRLRSCWDINSICCGEATLQVNWGDET